MQKKILIVDDVQFMINFEKNLLNILSKELSIEIVIDSAKTVKEALEKIAINDYHAMVIDMNLPDGSGREIAKVAKEKNKETSVAGLTIYPCDTEEHKEYFDALYKKPISPTLYKKNIKQLLGLE